MKMMERNGEILDRREGVKKSFTSFQVKKEKK